MGVRGLIWIRKKHVDLSRTHKSWAPFLWSVSTRHHVTCEKVQNCLLICGISKRRVKEKKKNDALTKRKKLIIPDVEINLPWL